VLSLVMVAGFASQGMAATKNPNTFLVTATPIKSVQAPADVYFGTYRLSNLSVRNAIHDMDVEGDSPLALPGQLERIAAVQSALAQWALLYPRDPWVPGTIQAFATFLLGKGLPQYDRVAYALLDELTLLYPQTKAGRAAQTQLDGLNLLPQFDLSFGPGVRPLPLIFESEPPGIGENRRRGLF
jgi:hypothetical protein